MIFTWIQSKRQIRELYCAHYLVAYSPATLNISGSHELELADTYANIVKISQGPAGAEVHAHSDDWHIQDVNLLGDVVHVSPDLLSVYTGHLESGKSMSIEYKTFAVGEHALNPVLGSLTVNTNRAFTKLDGIIASFGRPDRIEELTIEEVPPQYVMTLMIDDPDYTGQPPIP